MDRRDFLNGSLIAATAGLALDGCAPEASQLIPILVPEEPIVPGVETWIRSTCFECDARCGIAVRKIDGRLVKVEGNPDHPVSRGGLCARGQATPQSMYHPDRLQTPRERQSDGSFRPISWDDAIAQIASTLRETRDLSFLTGEMNGHRREIVRRFLRAFGSGRHLVHEAFGSVSTGYLDIESAGYVVSFGAELLESGHSPVRYGRGLAALRQGRPGRRGKFVMVGPRLSLTAANADEWIPARAGDTLSVVLAIAGVLLRDRLHVDGGFDDLDRFRELVAPYEPSETAERIAHEMAEHRPAIAIAGGGHALETAVSHVNALLGTEPLIAAPPPFRPWPAQPGDAPTTATLTRALDAAPPDVLFVADTNPAYSVPPAFGLDRWLQSIPLRVSFASVLDETAARCDLVLPESMSFERYEDAVPRNAPVPMATLSQPMLVRPLHDTRSMPDALIDIARAAGKEDDFPWTSYEAALRDAWSGLGTSWDEALGRGGWWGESAASIAGRGHRFDIDALTPPPPSSSDELELYVYPSMSFGDGRSAHLPFLQELSDPITGVRWGSVVEIAFERAETLGIRTGDRIEVRSASGALEAPAWVTPGLHPGVVAIAAGQGHREYGRYARGRGVNAYALLGRDSDGGVTSTSVTIRRIES